MDICIPKGETIWVQYFDEDGRLRYITTSSKIRDRYFLYKVSCDKLERVSKARTPISFDRHVKL